jgi:Non-histone chromosomal protein MC1
MNLRNFICRDVEGNEHGVFTGRHPRQAALKVACRVGGTEDSPVEIMIRERGTKKVHVFKAWKKLVNSPETRPTWLPAEIFKPFVRKVKMFKLTK